MPTILRASCLIYRSLLLSYPAELRHRFGEEMVEVFADQMRDEWTQHGPTAGMLVALTAGWEILTVAVPCHLQNSVVIAAMLSFVSSSALFLGLFRAVSR